MESRKVGAVRKTDNKNKQPEQSKRQNSTTPQSNPLTAIQRAKADPGLMRHSDVLQLQRTVGNQSVIQLLRESSSPSASAITEANADKAVKTPDSSGVKTRPAGYIQRDLKMGEKDWDYSPDLLKHKDTAEDQFKSDAALWYQTMFTQPGEGTGTKAERDKLKQQQEILKRNFLAQAVLGVQAGNQKTGEYQKLEDVKAKDGKLAGDQIPLAALSSHGGRIGYESEDLKSGRAFKNWMLTGQTDNAAQDTAGMYSRPMTHSQKYKDGQWQETGSTDRGLGMNLAFGGFGHEIKDTKGRSTTVGFEGRARAEQRGKPGHFTDYQLGSALMQYKETNKDGGSGRFMMGFEGTAPHMNNQLGAEHGVKSTLKKMLGGQANEISLTGQSKAKDAGLPSGMGALKADVTGDKMEQLTAVSGALDKIKGFKGGAEKEQEYFKRLLTSTTQEERNKIIKDINDEAALGEVVELPPIDYDQLMAASAPKDVEPSPAPTKAETTPASSVSSLISFWEGKKL